MTPTTSVAAAKTASETPVSQQDGASPVSVAGLRDQREILQRSAALLARELGDAAAELTKVETRLDGVGLAVPAREKFHTQRRRLREKMEDLKADIERGAVKIARLDQLLREGAADDALATRTQVQVEGTEVARQIMETISGPLVALYRQWLDLKEQDRLAKDSQLSLDPNKAISLATYSYVTGIDQTFAGAIGDAIGQCGRAQALLLKRAGEAHA